MPYRIAAIDEGALEDERELAAFTASMRRERNASVRRVLGASAFGLGAILVVSVYVMASEPPYTTITGAPSCIEDTCLCWLEEHHTWARFSCTPEPVGTCFKSLGTCR